MLTTCVAFHTEGVASDVRVTSLAPEAKGTKPCCKYSISCNM